MDSHNKVSVTVPQEVLTAVQQKLQETATLLAPYLQSITIEERQHLPKMSDKTVSFVMKTQGYTLTNAGFAPGFLNMAELAKDAALVNALSPVYNLAEQLAGNINDTIMLAGSEAYTACLLYYGSVKAAALSGVASARPIYEDLKQRFSGMGARKVTKEP